MSAAALLALAVSFAAGSVFAGLVRRRGGMFTTVYEWEHALAYVDGRFERLLGPGRHWTLGLARRDVFTLRKGDQLDRSPLVDVTSADRFVYRLSATVTYRVVDPREAFENGHLDRIRHAVATALVRLAAGRTLEAFLAERAGPADAALLALVGSPVCGCEIRAASVAAVVLPPEVRRLFSEVERARLEGAAALERARGEQAALRSLANAARLLKGNPELTNLRVLQALSVPGKGQPTLVLGQGALLPPTRPDEAAQGL